jgi:hypothetical protein
LGQMAQRWWKLCGEVVKNVPIQTYIVFMCILRNKKFTA